MKYLILKTPLTEYAQAISRFIYGMSVPTLNETTQYYCGWIEHPETNAIALVFPEVALVFPENANDSLPISPEANPVLLVDTIRTAITENEAVTLENLIRNAHTPQETTIDLDGETLTVSTFNNTISPIDHIPASLAGNIKTQEQMDAEGWFPVEEIGV